MSDRKSRYLITQAITHNSEKYPDQEALRFSGKTMSYGELESRSNRLAHVMVESGLRRGDRVGIYMNKSLESAIAMYGIMKAGGAYVPLDPLAPVSRTAYVINDCGIRQLVTTDTKLGGLIKIMADETPLELLIGVTQKAEMQADSIDWETVLAAPDHPLGLNLTEQDLAYILYTSGSTGNPKGIMHTHRSGLSFAEWAADEYQLTPSDRVTNHAPLHFDLSTFDYFATAIAGGCTVIIPEALTKFPANLSQLIEREQISIWYSVPFALIQLLERGDLAAHDTSSLRWILFAGEVFPTKHLRALMEMMPKVRFSNLFGPTETNVCTYYHVDDLPQDNDETIPIGKACMNIEDLVVDADDQPVEPCEIGELLIRGGVVMKGYWGQSEKTHDSFYRRVVFDQFEDHFYRTGDLVKVDSYGNYRYLGRKDRQIKVRGYRVELDEVEVALLSHSVVQEAATFPIPDGHGSNLIAAALILKNGANFDEDELVAHINDRLPLYAIPARFYFLSDFPRTSTGKINRRELQQYAIDFAGNE
jgi:amino acid adenylation domain-containing protein